MSLHRHYPTPQQIEEFRVAADTGKVETAALIDKVYDRLRASGAAFTAAEVIRAAENECIEAGSAPADFGRAARQVA